MSRKRVVEDGVSRDADDTRRASRSDDADAFIPDPETGQARFDDDIAEAMAEDFLQAATSGQEPTEEGKDELADEELGGPFVVTTAADEFAAGTDESNPLDATREAWPRATAAIVQPPYHEGGLTPVALEEDAEDDEEDDEDGVEARGDDDDLEDDEPGASPRSLAGSR